MENKLRIDGKYESYENRKVLQNRLSWVKDMIQGIEEWKKQGYGSMSAYPPYTVKNPNPLSCSLHNGCFCDGGEKIRAMFGTDELTELNNVLEKL